MEYIKKYENGLKVVVKEMPSFYSLTVGFCIGVGSSLEDETNNGFSHFIEHMMFKGTQKRSAREISESIDKIGGQINAFTSKDMTCYYAKVSSEYAEHSVEILSDMLLNSLFDENEMDRERKVILEEITMGDDEPDEVCHDLLAEAIFGNVGVGQVIIGPKELISKATRRDLMNFIDQYYSTQNITVAFAGNIKFEDACAYVEKYFLNNLNKSHEVKKLTKQNYHSNYLTKIKDVEQAHVAIGFKGVPLDGNDAAAYAIFVSIFGSGMSSRLFQKIREEHGMAYTVFAYPSYYVNNGYLEIYAGTNPKNIETVIELIKTEIDKIVTDGISEEEFARGKEQLKGGVLLSQENSSAVMTNLGRYCLLLDKKYTVEEKIKSINSTTKSDVERVIKQVLVRSSASMALVSKTEPPKDLLEKFKS